MIWNIIKKIILSGIISWIGFIIFLVCGTCKAKNDFWKGVINFIKIKDYDNRISFMSLYDKKADTVWYLNLLLWIGVFILLVFIILFFGT